MSSLSLLLPHVGLRACHANTRRNSFAWCRYFSPNVFVSLPAFPFRYKNIPFCQSPYNGSCDPVLVSCVLCPSFGIALSAARFPILFNCRPLTAKEPHRLCLTTALIHFFRRSLSFLYSNINPQTQHTRTLLTSACRVKSGLSYYRNHVSHELPSFACVFEPSG